MTDKHKKDKLAARKEVLRKQLDDIIEREKSDHDARIYTLGSFLFPVDPDMESAPVHALADIVDQLLAKHPVTALDALIEYAADRRSELAAKRAKKSGTSSKL